MAEKVISGDEAYNIKVIMKRGPKENMIREEKTILAAWKRTEALLSLHGLNTQALVIDMEARTFTIDASSYYTK